MKFKEIAGAYEVLSDPTKRSNYDRFGDVDSGPSGFGGRAGYNMHEVDPFEIFQAFFGGAGGQADLFGQMGFGGGGIHFANFGGPGMRFRQPGQRRAPQQSHMIRLEISLEDLYKGGKKRVNNEEIEIRKGMREGEKLRGSSSEYVIKEATHSVFTRKGDHLECTVVVSFIEWLLVGKSSVPIKHLDGSSIAVNIRPFSQTLLRPSAVVKGKGMPVAGSVCGDLIVYSSFLAKTDRESAKSLMRALGTVVLFMMVMWNPSLLFLVLLLKPLFS